MVLAVSAMACLALGGAAASDTGPMNILELVNSDPNLLVSATLLKSAGLASKLSGAGPITLFAPTNAVWGTCSTGAAATPPSTICCVLTQLPFETPRIPFARNVRPERAARPEELWEAP